MPPSLSSEDGNGGDVTVTGSKIEGDNVTLAANRDLLLQSMQETSEQVERNKASSGEIGITIGTEAGIGVYVSASAAKGKGDGNGTTYAETTVDAANTLALISGRDTTLEGAQARGETVIANVDRDLTLTSQQDSNSYDRKDQAGGIDVAVGFGGATVSGYYNQSEIDSNYQSVNQQTGIQAGAGGFDIEVGGHTQLTGAAIASTANPALNHLSTNSLSATDLNNRAEYEATSFGFSASGGTGGGSFSPNLAPPQSEEASSTTRAGISAGNIDIRNGNNSALASIDRSVTMLQQEGLKEIFDEQAVNERMEMGQVAGEVGMRAAGDLAQQMGWEEGSKEKVILHGVVGAAIAALGGGNALQGLAGAAASELATVAMQGYLRENDIDPNSSEGRTLMELGSLAVGAAVGGGNGAATALAGEQFNRQLHPDEIGRIKEIANGDPNVEAELIAAACALVKCSAGSTLGTEEYAYWAAVEAKGNSPEYADDRALLSANVGSVDSRYMNSTWQDTYPLFTYSGADAMSDWSSRNQAGTRTLGGLQMLGGSLEAAGGLLLVPTCETGIGCVAAGYLGFAGADNAQAGWQTMINGKPTSTLGGQALQGLGLSPGTAELVYGMTQLAPTAAAAFIANRAVNVESAANAWIRGTYTGNSAVSFEGRVYRFSDPRYADATWEIHPGNISADHRYSGPGVGSIYSGTAVETAAAEVASYSQFSSYLNPRVLVAGDLRIGGVLDLTDPSVRRALGVTRNQIVQSSHGVNGSYDQTQRIARWAREQGYNAILAPSAQNRSGHKLNYIRFNKGCE